MSKSSSTKLFIRFLHHRVTSNQTHAGNPVAGGGISQLLSHHPSPSPLPWHPRTDFSSSSTPISRFLQNPSGISKILQIPTRRLVPNGTPFPERNFLGFRHFCLKSSEMGGRNFAKKMVKNPKAAVKDTVSRYKEAVGLQIEAFWRRNNLVILGAGGLMVCILLWKLLFGIASTFIGLSEGLAKYGFLALSTAIVAFTGLYFRSRFTINPDKVYRMAMRRLNTNAGILEVMGAPLTGTDVRAYVMSGGGLTLKKFNPGLRGKRCFLIFPIRGSERKGLVSVEVKNKKGEYDMKLLAVDIPMSSGPDQRLFLIGDEEEYRIGGGLIGELRDPVLKALNAVKEFEDRDEMEDKEDAARELREAEQRHLEEIEKLDKSGSSNSSSSS
ncbi:uncharacterized protein LOC124919848 [Impatiens glandulifera]|uniref:uncharacterized protein LOC124919848 n=1 Tax=Impatiens glandulifera TaxID=253017 RepID=UPI001FB14779|nr:uncharacterized protein LOC124919848 [Impatiens glandulifera]